MEANVKLSQAQVDKRKKPIIRAKLTPMGKAQVKFLQVRDAGMKATEWTPSWQLRGRLLDIGGRFVILPVCEPDAGKIIARGELIYGRPIMKRGEPCRCHANAAHLWDERAVLKGGDLELMTGYGLSRDGIWRQHSWCWWPRKKKVVETTEARIAYYGFRLSEPEAEVFLDNNFL
jgi:hypothetical protein